MTPDLFLALVSFAFVTSITPGPNNMMLLASGVNFGFRRSLPHMAGISLGHMVMVVMTGLGLSSLLLAFPWAGTVLKLAALAYMLWLAWKIAHADAPGQGAVGARPMTFVQAAAFQWVNPKAWAMALGAIAAYAAEGGLADVALVAAVFAAVNWPSISVWTYAGTRLRRWLGDPSRLRLFNWGMAALLILSLLPVLRL